jgi:beta-galactosidase
MRVIPEWTDPMITGRNRVLTHAPLGAWPDVESALQGSPGPHVRSLDGTWQFTLTGSPDQRPEGFPGGDLPASWLDMPVPSNWQLDERVADQPIYTNMPYPFEGAPPYVPRANPTGWYWRTFDLPEDWCGREIFLHFESCDSACKIWVNGAEVGYSEDSKLPHEFNLTDFVHAGGNELAVMVPRYCTGFWLECQDYWHLSGIQRNVWLYSKPPAHIRDYVARTTFDEAFQDAELFVSVYMNERPDLGDGYAVAVQLYEALGAAQASPVASAQAALSGKSPMYGDTDPERSAARFRIPVVAPRQWTAETPYLYILVMTLTDPAGKAIDVERCRIGFRQVDIRDGVLRLNGRRLVLRGVNDHEHHPERGRALTTGDMRAELVAMKQLNFNAVRTSHYPHHTAFCDLCDELGMYVVDEANLETHGIEAQITKDPLWMNAFMERAQRMALRDRNHPCVIVWSLGNESYHGPHHAAMAAWLRHLDPTRPVQYESGFPGPAITDIMAPMYPKLDWVEEILADPEETRPMIMCEYAYSKGNALGNVFKYWDLVDRLPRFQGGFIWDWRDKALVREVDGSPEWAYGNEFDGGIGPDGYDYGRKENPQMCLNGVVNPDLTPKPGAWEVKKAQAPVAFLGADQAMGPEHNGRTRPDVELNDACCYEVTVWNQYLALDLSHLEIVWQLTVDGGVWQEGVLPAPDVAPGDRGVLRIPAPKTPRPMATGTGECWLNLHARQKEATPWSEAGHVVAWEQLSAGTAGGPGRSGVTPAPQGVPKEPEPTALDANGSLMTIRAGASTFIFDCEGGALTRWQSGGREILTRPLEHCFMRARTDNDYIIGNQNSYFAEWHAAGLDRLVAVVIECTREPAAEAQTAIRCVTRHAAPGSAYAIRCTTIYTFDSAGCFQVRNEVDASDLPVTTLPRVGMRCGLAAGFESLSWYGCGPHESYPDRKQSTLVGVYRSAVDEQFFPFVDPCECGGHTDTRWMELADAQGCGVRIEGLPALHVSALHYGMEDLMRAGHVYELTRTEEVHLHLDGAHMGLGGDTGWTPNVHPEFLLPPGVYRWSFKAAPFGRRSDHETAGKDLCS